MRFALVTSVLAIISVGGANPAFAQNDAADSETLFDRLNLSITPRAAYLVPAEFANVDEKSLPNISDQVFSSLGGATQTEDLLLYGASVGLSLPFGEGHSLSVTYLEGENQGRNIGTIEFRPPGGGPTGIQTTIGDQEYGRTDFEVVYQYSINALLAVATGYKFEERTTSTRTVAQVRCTTSCVDVSAETIAAFNRGQSTTTLNSVRAGLRFAAPVGGRNPDRLLNLTAYAEGYAVAADVEQSFKSIAPSGVVRSSGSLDGVSPGTDITVGAGLELGRRYLIDLRARTEYFFGDTDNNLGEGYRIQYLSGLTVRF